MVVGAILEYQRKNVFATTMGLVRVICVDPPFPAAATAAASAGAAN